MGFFEYLNNTLIMILSIHGWIAVLVTMTLESALVPIPSEIVMPYCGYVSWSLGLGIGGIIYYSSLATLGNVIGSIGAYYLGAHGGRRFIEKYGRYFLIGEKEFNKAQELFEKYGGKAVLFGRVLPAIRTVISLPAGIFRMDLKKFMLYTIIGSIPWNIMLTTAGFLLGPSWHIIAEYFHVADLVLITCIIVLLAYIIYKRIFFSTR